MAEDHSTSKLEVDNAVQINQSMKTFQRLAFTQLQDGARYKVPCSSCITYLVSPDKMALSGKSLQKFTLICTELLENTQKYSNKLGQWATSGKPFKDYGGSINKVWWVQTCATSQQRRDIVSSHNARSQAISTCEAQVQHSQEALRRIQRRSQPPKFSQWELRIPKSTPQVEWIPSWFLCQYSNSTTIQQFLTVGNH